MIYRKEFRVETLDTHCVNPFCLVNAACSRAFIGFPAEILRQQEPLPG
jgi:hypothetical protein